MNHKDLQEQIDKLIAGETVAQDQKSPRQFTNEAAREAKRAFRNSPEYREKYAKDLLEGAEELMELEEDWKGLDEGTWSKLDSASVPTTSLPYDDSNSYLIEIKLPAYPEYPSDRSARKAYVDECAKLERAKAFEFEKVLMKWSKENGHDIAIVNSFSSMLVVVLDKPELIPVIKTEFKDYISYIYENAIMATE